MFEPVRYINVSREDAGQRLDNYLIRQLKGVPKSLIYRIIRRGEVRLNKGRAKPERKLCAGDCLRLPPLRMAEVQTSPLVGDRLRNLLQQAILKEEKSWLALNKPAGLAVHGGSGVHLGLIESLRQMMPQYPSLELVHRLDRETSGCLLVAKKRSALKYLQSLFREEKSIRKRYLALVAGSWPGQIHQVDAPLRKNELLGGERIVRVQIDGKPAKTEFAVTERFGQQASLLRAEPVTGRTHQIRVHARHVGCPLVGDEKYGDPDCNKSMKAHGIHRLFLHAEALEFTCPEGQSLSLSAPLPVELQAGLESLRASEQASGRTPG